LKLYYPKSHYNKNFRSELFPLLKPFIKTADFTDAQRIASYGVSEKDFQWIDNVKRADYVILTMAWNYYVKTKQEALAIAFVKECATLKKKVLAFNAGDFGVQIPYLENLIILRPSGYNSKFTKNEFSLPAFIADPLRKYFQTDTIFERPYQSKAAIGFCGQANPSPLNAIKEIVKTFIRNIRGHIGFSKAEPQQLLASNFLRDNVLKRIQKSADVETNFIIRAKYRAGVKSNKNSHKTTLEFYNNLKNSDYIVCVRGAGNFSVRFYETLAMGRIPILINTDCALPLDNQVEWKKHVVWVEYNERHQVVQKVKQFHEALSKDDFIDLQHNNRTLWIERLTLKGFFKTFFDEI
jgi:Exostosin family